MMVLTQPMVWVLKWMMDRCISQALLKWRPSNLLLDNLRVKSNFSHFQKQFKSTMTLIHLKMLQISESQVISFNETMIREWLNFNLSPRTNLNCRKFKEMTIITLRLPSIPKIFSLKWLRAISFQFPSLIIKISQFLISLLIQLSLLVMLREKRHSNFHR
jgi:hypothetical protein